MATQAARSPHPPARAPTLAAPLRRFRREATEPPAGHPPARATPPAASLRRFRREATEPPAGHPRLRPGGPRRPARRVAPPPRGGSCRLQPEQFKRHTRLLAHRRPLLLSAASVATRRSHPPGHPRLRPRRSAAACSAGGSPASRGKLPMAIRAVQAPHPPPRAPPLAAPLRRFRREATEPPAGTPAAAPPAACSAGGSPASRGKLPMATQAARSPHPPARAPPLAAPLRRFRREATEPPAGTPAAAPPAASGVLLGGWLPRLAGEAADGDASSPVATPACSRTSARCSSPPLPSRGDGATRRDTRGYAPG